MCWHCTLNFICLGGGFRQAAQTSSRQQFSISGQCMLPTRLMSHTSWQQTHHAWFCRLCFQVAAHMSSPYYSRSSISVPHSFLLRIHLPLWIVCCKQHVVGLSVISNRCMMEKAIRLQLHRLIYMLLMHFNLVVLL